MKISIVLLIIVAIGLLVKENKDMAVIYATLIIKGKKTFSQVPSTLKAEVKQILIDCDCEFLIEE